MSTGRLEDEFSRRTIARHCESALRQADALNVFPTPVDQILEVVGGASLVDISDLPSGVSRAKPKLLKRLLGAVLFRESTVFVDLNQTKGRVLWTKGHETTHLILPWHEAGSQLDDHERLFGDSAAQLEVEANFGAAHLIFQGQRALAEALDYRHGLDVALVLANRTGASIHASIRYYVEHHPEPMALATTGRRQANGHLPIYLLTHSPSWSERFALPANVFGEQRLKVDTGAFAESVAAREGGRVGVTHRRLRDLRGDLQPISVESFDNGYNKFFLVRTRSRVELGRRVSALARPA